MIEIKTIKAKDLKSGDAIRLYFDFSRFTNRMTYIRVVKVLEDDVQVQVKLKDINHYFHFPHNSEIDIVDAGTTSYSSI